MFKRFLIITLFALCGVILLPDDADAGKEGVPGRRTGGGTRIERKAPNQLG